MNLSNHKVPDVVRTPSRFRNPIGKYRLSRSKECTACGKCVESCLYGVHEMKRGRVLTRNAYRCVGPDCTTPCTKECPTKALSLRRNPTFDTMGDYRWTPDLLASTWHMAETGLVPPGGLEYRTGASGGGFDKLRLVLPLPGKAPAVEDGDVDMGVDLNRRNDHAHRVRIEVPFYGGGMSYGSVSITTMLSRIKAAATLGTLCCTGEGGYPDELKPYDDHVITQVATGLFGVREETIKRVKIVEFKYAQGAKPGLGGHLLGDKVTPGVARMREAVVGFPLFSPFPFHSVYSVEDHKKHVDWIKAINPQALVSVKVSTPTDVDMVAVGSYYAGAHIIHLDGSYGGTGAAPDIAKKNIAMPIEYAGGGEGENHGHCERGNPDAPRRGQDHRPGCGRCVHGHGGPGGPGVHPVPQLRKRPRVRQGHRDHGRGTHEPDRPGMGDAEDYQSLSGMEKGTGAHSQEAWDEEHPRARGPHGLFGAFGLYGERMMEYWSGGVME